jgi:hypothetical protein
MLFVHPITIRPIVIRPPPTNMGQKMGRCFGRGKKATSARHNHNQHDPDSRLRLTSDPVQPTGGMTSTLGTVRYTTITDDRLEPFERNYALAQQASVNTMRQLEALKSEWADLSPSSQELFLPMLNNQYDQLQQKLNHEMTTMQTCNKTLTMAKSHQHMLTRNMLDRRGKEMLDQMGVTKKKVEKLAGKVTKDAEELHSKKMMQKEVEEDLADEDNERDEEDESTAQVKLKPTERRNKFLEFVGGLKSQPNNSVELTAQVPSSIPSAVAPAAVTIRNTHHQLLPHNSIRTTVGRVPMQHLSFV